MHLDQSLLPNPLLREHHRDKNTPPARREAHDVRDVARSRDEPVHDVSPFGRFCVRQITSMDAHFAVDEFREFPLVSSSALINVHAINVDPLCYLCWRVVYTRAVSLTTRIILNVTNVGVARSALRLFSLRNDILGPATFHRAGHLSHFRAGLPAAKRAVSRIRAKARVGGTGAFTRNLWARVCNGPLSNRLSTDVNPRRGRSSRRAAGTRSVVPEKSRLRCQPKWKVQEIRTALPRGWDV